MFHGPAFAGVHEVTAVADDGIRGVLRALPAPGALLDAAGQLLGHWMQLRLPADRLVFPASLERVSLYGPAPRDGALLRATARIRAVRPGSVRGRRGTRRRRRHGVGPPGRLDVPALRRRRAGVADEVHPGDLRHRRAAARRLVPGPAPLDRPRLAGAGDAALSGRRRARGVRAAPAAGPRGLAARADRRQGRRTPAAVGRRRGAALPRGGPGRQRRRGPPPRARARSPPDCGSPSPTRTGWPSAYAHPGHAVGIDIEAVTEDPAALSRIALTADERRLADQLAAREGFDRAQALTALWSAKEAAAKAEGTGLGGRLRQWTVTDGPTGLRVISPAGPQPHRTDQHGRRSARPGQPSHHPCCRLDRTPHPHPHGGQPWHLTPPPNRYSPRSPPCSSRPSATSSSSRTRSRWTTTFNEDLALESIEFVALAELLQQRYGAAVDLIAFLAEKDMEEILAMTVGDLVSHIAGTPAPAGAGSRPDRRRAPAPAG